MNWVLSAFGAETMTVYRVALPLGISFYTFQSMSYSIDLYRGHARPARSLLDFSCYVALFPQLVAGPIVRYSDLAEQLSRRTHTIDKFARGIAFFALGFGKKILLANPMGEVTDAAFDAGGLMWYDAWTGAVAYAFQIYFDFSGYSDMAIGLGLMLGFTFPKNFDSPYRARSITEFWERWHMSLSTWLRDYLYVPLGGNRKGTGRTYVNLMLVMLLGGLWHGASWTFVVWGGIHGGMLVLERAMGKDAAYRRAPRAVRTAVTFAIVVVSLVFFRAYDLPAAVRYLGAMLGLGGAAAGAGLVASTIYTLDHALAMGACAFIVWGCGQTWEHARSVGPVKAVFLVLLMLWSCAVMFTQTYNPFIYFFF
jgi:alginate O-acetyltransferase complex protein AlgI